MLAYQTMGAAHVGIGETDRPDEHGFIGPNAEIDLGFAVAQHMDMRRLMIVEINDDPKTATAQDRYHELR